MSDKPKGAPLIQAVVTVTQLDGGGTLAQFSCRHPVDQLADGVRARAPSSCEYFSPRVRKFGCLVRVRVGYIEKGRKVNAQEMTSSCLATPENVSAMAFGLTSDCVRNLREVSDGEGIIDDVMGTTVRVLADVRGWLPKLDAIANGDASALVVGVGQDMMRDPEGAEIMRTVIAAASGDETAAGKIKEKTDGMGDLGGLLTSLLSSMGKK